MTCLHSLVRKKTTHKPSPGLVNLHGMCGISSGIQVSQRFGSIVNSKQPLGWIGFIFFPARRHIHDKDNGIYFKNNSDVLFPGRSDQSDAFFLIVGFGTIHFAVADEFRRDTFVRSKYKKKKNKDEKTILYLFFTYVFNILSLTIDIDKRSFCCSNLRDSW